MEFGVWSLELGSVYLSVCPFFGRRVLLILLILLGR